MPDSHFSMASTRVLLGLLPLIATTYACMCMYSPTEEIFCGSVFVSKVIVNQAEEFPFMPAYSVEHIEIFKKPKNLADLPSKVIAGNPRIDSCGVELFLGGENLISGRIEGDHLSIDLCSMMLRLSDTSWLKDINCEPKKPPLPPWPPLIHEPPTLHPTTVEPEIFEPPHLESETFEPQTFATTSLAPTNLENQNFTPQSFEPPTLESQTFEPQSFEPPTLESQTFEPPSFEPPFHEPRIFAPPPLDSSTYDPQTQQTLTVVCPVSNLTYVIIIMLIVVVMCLLVLIVIVCYIVRGQQKNRNKSKTSFSQHSLP
ncbi:hypothetical protein PRIPAC_83344, partial [Pristionchus pacificus]|uniref:Uncharacterized protein n=1 Tax=Pristionchus pacificus TaxID=54126 RepID=A0A2A6BTH9_PRIPA